MGYSVDKQLAQDLKVLEGLNQELTKTEKRQQTLSLDSDQAQEILNKLEEKLRRLWLHVVNSWLPSCRQN